MEEKKSVCPTFLTKAEVINTPLSFLKPLKWTKSKSHATEGKTGLYSDFSLSLILYTSFGKSGGCWSVTSLPLPLWSSCVSSSRTLWRLGHVSLLQLPHLLQISDTERRGQESQNPRGHKIQEDDTFPQQTRWQAVCNSSRWQERHQDVTQCD